MWSSLRALRPGTPTPHLVAHVAARAVVRAFLTIGYRPIILGWRRVPATGPVLLVANHQSYLDPPLVGVCVRHRALDYIARAGLFNNWFMRTTRDLLNCIPIREDGNDPAAIKDVLRRLSEGRAVLIFPEGTRSPDGAMVPFKRGAALLVKRARCPVVPVAVEGCFDAWPRHAKLPDLIDRRLACAFGRPMDSEALMSQGPDAAMRELEERVARLQRLLRRRLRVETAGAFPPQGAADEPRSSTRRTPRSS